MLYDNLNGKTHIRYYDKDGKYLDHGRVIYSTVPNPGDIICPLQINWKVVEVKFPEDDPCAEIYVEQTCKGDIFKILLKYGYFINNIINDFKFYNNKNKIVGSIIVDTLYVYDDKGKIIGKTVLNEENRQAIIDESIEFIREILEKGDKMSEKFTLFWGEAPFSQWCEIGFTIDGIFYNTAEQYMMAKKAEVFGDKDIQEQIMQEKSPKYQKRLGRQIKGFNDKHWDKFKETVVYDANYAKFTQNPEALKDLMATDGTTLVEASPYDKIWGIGLEATNPDCLDRSKWQGLNLLGKVLTQVREDLRGQARSVQMTKGIFDFADRVNRKETND